MVNTRLALAVAALIFVSGACAPGPRLEPSAKRDPPAVAKGDPKAGPPAEPVPKLPSEPTVKTAPEPVKSDLPAVFPLIHWATTQPAAADGAVAEILRGGAGQSDGLRVRREAAAGGRVEIAGPESALPAGTFLRFDLASNTESPADLAVDLVGPATTVKFTVRAAPAQAAEPTVVLIPFEGRLTSLVLRPSGSGAWDATLRRADAFTDVDARFEPLPRDTQLVVDVRFSPTLAFSSAEVMVLREGSTAGSPARLVRKPLQPGARVAIFSPADLAAPPLLAKAAVVCVLVRSDDGLRAVGRVAVPIPGRAMVRKFVPADFVP